MSTHRMNEIEEMCDRILMINKGRTVLYGDIPAIKAQYRNNSVLVECEGEPGDIQGVTGKHPHNKVMELVLDDETTPQLVLERLLRKGVIIRRFELSTPSLNEIFIKVAGEEA
jgi:ABC-2 type transport system ATP-binding protein